MKNTVFMRLRADIKAKGITQSHIARVTNIERNKMYDILKGRRDIRMDELIAICSAINEKPSKYIDDPLLEKEG